MKRRRWLIALTAALMLNAVLWLAAPGYSLPRALQVYLLGPKMIRAEVVLKSNGLLHDVRVDTGRIRAVNSATLTITLRERDGLVQTIQVAPTARIRVNGSSSTFAALRVGMRATTIRDNSDAADQVFATR
jgi:hypothetical protein